MYELYASNKKNTHKQTNKLNKNKNIKTRQTNDNKGNNNNH